MTTTMNTRQVAEYADFMRADEACRAAAAALERLYEICSEIPDDTNPPLTTWCDRASYDVIQIAQMVNALAAKTMRR